MRELEGIVISGLIILGMGIGASVVYNIDDIADYISRRLSRKPKLSESVQDEFVKKTLGNPKNIRHYSRYSD